MTRFTGPRMAIPTFKTPVETIASPYPLSETATQCDETTFSYKVRFLILNSFSACLRISFFAMVSRLS